MKLVAELTLLGFSTIGVMGCGLDWSLPQAHFDGVDEHGYVAYWEKIGDADLGNGMVIPVNVGFSSHREVSSPTLGKGWIIPLLESHIEPIDENSMNVIMPDGWTFTFFRNGSSNTWRGNAGWVGETDNTIFIATAPCGWRIKFDQGKIQEVQNAKSQMMVYKYNGGTATEVDFEGKPMLQSEINPTNAQERILTIVGQRINIVLDKRPQIMERANRKLITGFDFSASQFEWDNGTKESFIFGVTNRLDPSLTIQQKKQKRIISWNPDSQQIIKDNNWTYYNLHSGVNIPVSRKNEKGEIESYYRDDLNGITTTQGLDGVKLITKTYVNAGILNGRTKSVTEINNGVVKVLQHFDYNEKGQVIRAIIQMSRPHDFTYKYNPQGLQSEVDVDNKLWITKTYDSNNRLIAKLQADGSKKSYEYLSTGIKESIYLPNGKIVVNMLNNAFQNATNITQIPTNNARKETK